MVALSEGDRTVRRSASWSVITQAFSQGALFLVFLITARFVPPASFGAMAICLAVIDAVRQIAVESVGTVMTAQSNISDEDYNAAFWLVFLSSAGLAAVSFACAGAVSWIAGNPDVAPTLRWCSIVMVTYGLSRIHEVRLAKSFRFGVLLIRTVVSVGIAGIISIAMALHGFGLSALIAQQVIMGILTPICLWIGADWIPRPQIEWRRVRDIWRQSRHVVRWVVVTLVNTQGDVFFSSAFLGGTLTGIYSASRRIMTALSTIFASGLNDVMLPRMAAIPRDDVLRLREAYLRVLRITSTILAPLYCGVACLSHDLIAVLLGPKWRGVGLILSIVAATGYTSVLNRFNTNVFLTRDKAQYQTYLTTCEAAANIVLMLILARFGLVPLAAGILFRASVFYVLTSFFATRLLGASWLMFAKALAPSLAAAAIMAVLILATGHIPVLQNHLLRLIGLSGFGAIIYTIALRVLDRPAFAMILSLAAR